MSPRLLVLSLLSPLVACASAPEKSAPPPAVEHEAYTYRVAVPDVPKFVRQMVVSVRLPSGPLEVQSVRGLVGNAPFEISLPRDQDASWPGDGASSDLWSCHYAHGSRELQVTTSGKPLELGLRCSLPRGASGVEEIERSLAA